MQVSLLCVAGPVLLFLHVHQHGCGLFLWTKHSPSQLWLYRPGTPSTEPSTCSVPNGLVFKKIKKIPQGAPSPPSVLPAEMGHNFLWEPANCI